MRKNKNVAVKDNSKSNGKRVYEPIPLSLALRKALKEITKRKFVTKAKIVIKKDSVKLTFLTNCRTHKDFTITEPNETAMLEKIKHSIIPILESIEINVLKLVKVSSKKKKK